MLPALRSLFRSFASLKLTVALLAFSIVLVFAATLDQVNLGIWGIQQKWLRSFVVYQPVGALVVPVFPGGYTIGGLLLLNLIAAHTARFSLSVKKLGLLVTHAGLILLLIGELLSGIWQQDFYLRLNEGETKSYAESHLFNELVIIDTTAPDHDDVVAIPEELLAERGAIQHPKLPFRVEVKTHYKNALLFIRENSAQPTPATAGLGLDVVAAPQPVTYRPNEANQPAALVAFTGPDGSLGTFLVSTALAGEQGFTHAGRTWKIALRPQRFYQPFALTLLKFSHDRYAGTEIPKNFSSRLHLKTPEGRDDRDVLIYMNNPLRYAGLTFYQAGFENNDLTSVLQVVRNPSWIIPYVSCALMTLGLLGHFGQHLVGFICKRRVRVPVVA